MRSCHQHVANDSDPQRARWAAPKAQGSRGASWDDPLGLPAQRDRADWRAANARRNACPPPRADPRQIENTGRGDNSTRARVRMIVVDASAITEFLLQTEVGARVERRLYREDEDLHAPHLLDVEVLSALRRLVQAREVEGNRAQEALDDLPLLRLI